MIALSCAKLCASVIETVPVCSVTVPANANIKSAAVPDRAPFVTTSMIAPVVASLITFNCETVGALLSVTMPV